jgi:lysophospholipase L1-like esterase
MVFKLILKIEMVKKVIIAIVTICVVGLLIGTLIGHHPKKTNTASSQKLSYVALGDSVAAGLGLETYSDSSACDRTNQAYPDLVAKTLNLKLDSLACSGATLSTGILGPQTVNQLSLTPQIDKLFNRPKPYLITITIGANDINWTGLISKCYTGQCGSASDTAAVNQSLATLSTNLSNALTQINQHYKDAPPYVVVTGYHQVFPDSGASTCSDLTGIDASELSWGRQVQANLNTTIQSVVNKRIFAKFAPIDFTNHELCTKNSWVQGLNDNDPYHPTDAGQAEYAKQVEAALKALKQGMI